MAGKQKKSIKKSGKQKPPVAPAKSKAVRPSSVKKAVSPEKKSVSPGKKSSVLPEGKKVKTREILVEVRSDSRKRLVMEVLKKENYQVFDRKFEIHTLKNEKRKRLAVYVYEITDSGSQFLPNLQQMVGMPDPKAPPEDVPAYGEILALVKRSVDTFADSTLNKVKEFLWSQFGASIDMLQNAIKRWPGKEWGRDKRFFYIAYHTLVFLDYYLTDPAVKFSPQLSFTLTGPDARPAESLDDVIPDRIYNKKELLDYGETLRWKCKSVISFLNNDRLGDRWIEKDGGMNYGQLEILLYNMRHVQHHAAQLNMLLRTKIGDAPGWIGRATDELS